MEDLLTENEIASILDEIKKEIYSDDKILHLGRNKTSIILHSKQSGLILIQGNSDTGYEHIFNRHSLMSRIPFWDNEKRLGKPSKFRIENAPIEYLPIAEKIFFEKNLDVKNNKSLDKFDLYVGEYTHFDLKKIQYKLLTYKNTGIIHTFFVSSNKKPFNPKKVLNLRKGWTKAKDIPSQGVHLFNFSYYDINKVERAKVLLKCDSILEKEEWSVDVYDLEGEIICSELVKSLDYKRDGIHNKIEQHRN